MLLSNCLYPLRYFFLDLIPLFRLCFCLLYFKHILVHFFSDGRKSFLFLMIKLAAFTRLSNHSVYFFLVYRLKASFVNAEIKVAIASRIFIFRRSVILFKSVGFWRVCTVAIPLSFSIKCFLFIIIGLKVVFFKGKIVPLRVAFFHLLNFEQAFRL